MYPIRVQALSPLSLTIALVCLLSVFAAGVRAYELPSTAPKSLKDAQDPAEVQAHKAARERQMHEASAVPAEWAAQIQESAGKLSHREGMPVERLTAVFKKDGKLDSLQLEIPTAEKRTPNAANQSHRIAAARYNSKLGKLKLDATDSLIDGPDLYELFGVVELPTVFRELSIIQDLQRAFTANGLKYALEARVILAPKGKSWAWEIGPAEEQSPNVIYGMIYYPVTGELRTIKIDSVKLAPKVDLAAKQAGMQLKIVKEMGDR